MTTCSRCGLDNPPEARFCRHCSRFMSWDEPPPREQPLVGSPSGPPPPPPPPPAAIVTSRWPAGPPKASGAMARPVRPAIERRVVRPPSGAIGVDALPVAREAPWSETGVGAMDEGHGLFMVVEHHELAVDPGGEVQTVVRVRNSGLHVERAVIEVIGLPESWVTRQPASLELDRGSEASASVTFHPPRAATTVAG